MKFTRVSTILTLLAATSHTATAFADFYPTTCHERTFPTGEVGEVCASTEYYGPSVVPQPGEGYQYIYDFDGVYERLLVTVEWQHQSDITCTARINDQTCQTCIRCDPNDSGDPVALDCSNLEVEQGYGIPTTCQRLQPLGDNVLFPLDPHVIYSPTPEPTEPYQYCYANKQELKADIDAYMMQLANPQADYFDMETKGEIGTWCTTKVTDFSWLFSEYTEFNEPLDGWDLSNALRTSGMFNNARAFNQPIGHWDMSKVKDASYMFQNAHVFNQDLPWYTPSLEKTKRMFFYVKAFNGDVSSWDTSKVDNMMNMFLHAHAFNRNANGWVVNKVTNMGAMFAHAYSFNQDLDQWDTSEVTTMKDMFHSAHAFNGDVSNFQTQKVTTMRGMFYSAISFDQSLSGWDVTHATDMKDMFYKAESFDQNMCAWEPMMDQGVPPNVERMFERSGCAVTADPVVGTSQSTNLCHPCASS